MVDNNRNIADDWEDVGVDDWEEVGGGPAPPPPEGLKVDEEARRRKLAAVPIEMRKMDPFLGTRRAPNQMERQLEAF